METTYFFGEHIRWSFGLENPNIAGAVITMLIALLLPFTSALPPKRWLPASLSAALLFLELSLWFCLAKTYSRGALIAAVVCLITCNIVLFLRKRFSRKDLFPLFAKIAAIVIIIVSVGFSARISPVFLQNDGSANARITLWQGGLKMIAASPAKGWGVGNSGSEYINWYQAIDDDRKYAGMVNSYLHIGVERGLPVLFLPVFAMLLFFLLGVSSSSQRDSRKCTILCTLGAALAILAFAIANMFSTLWIYPVLQSLLVLAMLIIAISRFPLCAPERRAWAKALGVAILAACMFCLCLYGAGRFLSHGSHIRKTQGLIVFQNSPKPDHLVILMILDDVSLGEYYGKEIRQALQNTPIDFCLVGPHTAIPSKALPKIDRVIIFGERSKILKELEPHDTRIILANPVGSPPQYNSPLSVAAIYLSQFDIYNQHSRWLRFAHKKNIPVAFLEASDQRISTQALEHLFLNLKNDQPQDREN